MKSTQYRIALLMALCLLATPALADSITGIRVSQPSPSYLVFNQSVDVRFKYTTDRAGGVRIFARPFTAGELSPGYTASPSPVYPVGSGTGGGLFTIARGEGIVDQIRFQMLSEDESEIIMEFFIDVELYFGAHGISDISFDPPGFASLQHNQNVSVSFDFSTTEPGGVRIFARPYTDGDLSPDFSAHGSPIHPAGAGSASGSFTITEGNTTVDQVRFRMANADQSVILLEFFLDVRYIFNEHAIQNIVLTPATPASFPLDSQSDRVSITFDYATTEPGGVRIFARPYSNGFLSPAYLASGSPIHPVGNGSGTGSFTITEDRTHVDVVFFRMFNADQSELLLEFGLTVDYLFSQNRVDNIEMTYASPGYFTLGEEATFSADYTVVQPGGAMIFGRPITGRVLSPGYSAHASPTHFGTGAMSGSFTFLSNAARVDYVRFQVLAASGSEEISEYFLPVEYHFIPRFSNVANEDEAGLPGTFALEQNYPNPFNPTTTVPFSLPRAGTARLDVFDMLGRQVRTLVDGTLPAGRHEVSFDAASLPSGMYLYRLTTDAGVQTRTLALMK